ADVPAPARRGRCLRGVAPLYVLVGLSAGGWVLLLALGLRQQMQILEELKLLRSNYSENEENVRQELEETRRQLTRLRSGMHQYYQELQDVAGLICKSVTDGRKCSSGWKNFGKSCYFFSTETTPWAEARETCADLGAHLLIVDSEPEQGFLMDNIETGTYWLGATDELVEGTWVWTNGQQVNFSYWNTWKKDKEREEKDCGIIGPGGIWSDARCSHPNRWICEKSWNC
ncbi:PREDICTED: CD209 antigen-like protein C, partial [Calidris pugnax]|uniref:CD209 antigen-like protein C n=1 Tax=Calidris pugnax TaxID=198806 RepID=UPI00071E1CCE